MTIGTPAMAGPAIQLVAQFRQTPPAKGALPKVARYKNEDMIRTTSTTIKTPVYTTVQVPIVKNGKTIGFTPMQKITGYNTVTTKATNITPKSELYTTNGSNTTPAAAPATFEYMRPIQNNYMGNLNGDQAALMTLHAVATSAPQLLGNGQFSQLFDSGTLIFTRATPVRYVGTHGAEGPLLSNLLTVTFTNAFLSGQIGGTAAAFTASTALPNMLFKSDFMTSNAGNTPTEFSFLIAQDAITPNLSIAGVDPALTNVSGSRSLTSFRSNAMGQFSSNGVPEPASWALMIARFGLVGAASRRRAHRISVLQH